jgi:transposase
VSGSIRPPQAVRDLLRKRSQLVQQRTANILSVQNLFARNLGRTPSGNEVKRLQEQNVEQLLKDEFRVLICTQI